MIFSLKYVKKILRFAQDDKTFAVMLTVHSCEGFNEAKNASKGTGCDT